MDVGLGTEPLLDLQFYGKYPIRFTSAGIPCNVEIEIKDREGAVGID